MTGTVEADIKVLGLTHKSDSFWACVIIWCGTYQHKARRRNRANTNDRAIRN